MLTIRENITLYLDCFWLMTIIYELIPLGPPQLLVPIRVPILSVLGPRSQISGPRSLVWVPGQVPSRWSQASVSGLKSQVPSPSFQVPGPESQVLGPRSQVISSRYKIPSPGPHVPGLGSLVPRCQIPGSRTQIQVQDCRSWVTALESQSQLRISPPNYWMILGARLLFGILVKVQQKCCVLGIS